MTSLSNYCQDLGWQTPEQLTTILLNFMSKLLQSKTLYYGLQITENIFSKRYSSLHLCNPIGSDNLKETTTFFFLFFPNWEKLGILVINVELMTKEDNHINQYYSKTLFHTGKSNCSSIIKT